MAKLEDATRTMRVVLFSAMTMGSIGLVATAYALEPDAEGHADEPQKVLVPESRLEDALEAIEAERKGKKKT